MILLTQDWNNFLAAFDDNQRDVYFHEEYVKLYETDIDQAECFVYKEANDLFLFPYLKRENYVFGENFFDFETPYGYGGPLCNTLNTDFLIKAQNEFIKYCDSNNIIAGFVRFHPLLNNDLYFENIGEVINDRQTIAIDLSISKKKIWEEEIHSKHRNVIRKAETNGLEFLVDRDFKYLNEFENLYQSTMNKVGADNFFYFTKDYYLKLKETIPSSFLGIVKNNDRIICASIFFHSNMFGHYHLSGSDVNYLHLYPNNYLIYKTALYLKELGMDAFHLGGGSSSDPENSLFKFKERFSKSKLSFKIGKAIFNAEKYKYIINNWDRTNEEKRDIYKSVLLKYRY